MNTFGWDSIALDSDMPASTSLRTCTIVSLRNLFSVCSSSTYSARKIDKPEVIIVASWREKTARSLAFTVFMKLSSISREACLSAMLSTIMPRDFSWSETACLESASISPRALPPDMSIALKT